MNGKPLLKEKDKPKKERKRSMSAIETELWELCKKITRLRYKDCYTCFQKNLVKWNAQTGHMHPDGACGASMKYDLRILRLQCFQCNINHGGMGAVFKANMDYEIGKEASDALLAEAKASKGKPIKARDHYLKLTEEYKHLLVELSTE